MSTEQLNLRVPSALAAKLRQDAHERRILPRDILMELLESRYGKIGVPVIRGQLDISASTAPAGRGATLHGDNRPADTLGEAPGNDREGAALRGTAGAVGAEKLTVDEAQGAADEPTGSRPVPPAPRRPRAAEQAERPEEQPAGDDMAPAGCPECGGDMSPEPNETQDMVRWACPECSFQGEWHVIP